jgi:hypothetical protein
MVFGKWIGFFAVQKREGGWGERWVMRIER